jgi:hypothetical protein
MSAGVIFYILFALFIKHLLIDFPLYSRYICKNQEHDKTSLWSLHILFHGIATFAILWLMALPIWMCLLLACVDWVSHFTIDSIAIRFYEKYKVDPAFEEKYYWVVDLDQYFHTATYVVIAFIALILFV